MGRHEDDFKLVTQQLAGVREEMTKNNKGPASHNPIDLVEKNAKISELEGQLEEVQNISRKQDRELLERDGELKSLKEKIKQGMRAMGEQEEELKRAKERLSELAR